MTTDGLFLGHRDGERVELEPSHLTTHAVCLGMTGSGKTGLGIVALEELARRGTPLIVVDLKGDMVDLLLNFPDLAAQDFLPWLSPDAAPDGDREAAARAQAELWRKGLEREGLGGSDLRAVAGGVRWQVVTPGLSAAAPLDILPSLSAPAGWDPGTDPDGARQRVDGVTGALLSLIGRGGDPLTDKDHVLLASILLELWTRRVAVDLAGLLSALADPPLERLGALPLETLYPRKERMELVFALNTLLASPAFGAWTEGTPLVMEELLGTREAPRATIVMLAHLDEPARLFVLSLLASELVAWMRRQPASAALRALMYIDEVQGILPPHPANPPTKGPLLTLFKQGRAFGVGAWLATQNPVDLDYRALGNAGVKVIGRLITDRDRERALEGLGLTVLDDGRKADSIVASLAKREFLLHDVRARESVRTFSSRWAMSYLRGPVAAAELGPLLERFTPAGEAAGGAAFRDAERTPAGRPVAGCGRPEAPLLEVDTPVRFGQAGPGLAEPWLLVKSRVTVEEKVLHLYRTLNELWHIPVDEEGRPSWDDAELLGDGPELSGAPPAGMRFPAAAPPRLARGVTGAEKEFATWRARRPVVVMANRALKLAAEPDESREELIARCLSEADRADDAEQERVRLRFQRKMDTLRRRLEREKEELERDRREVQARKAEESLGIAEGLMSVLLGSRGLRSAARKAGSRVRAAAGKHRMRQRAEGSVEESVGEIQRLEDELAELADELQDEINRIADLSEEKAQTIEEVQVRPRRTDVEVDRVMVVWGSRPTRPGGEEVRK